MSNVSSERRKAVAQAWNKEKGLVVDGKGTRDWSQKEQREIIAKGKAKGYEGHHMKSVDGHNSKAGDPDNIQFLTRKEHYNAHKGDFRNNTNGRYDPATGKMHEFGRNKASIESKSLSNPLNASQKRFALNKAEAARNKAKSGTKRTSNKAKSVSISETNKNSSVQSKTLQNQRTTAPTRSSSTATKSKTLSAQRSSSTPSKGTSSGMGHSSSAKSTSSGKSTSGGHSTSGGKGSSHGR